MAERYLEEVVLPLVVELIFFPALGVHEKVVDGNPDLSLGFGQSSVLCFGDDGPLAVLVNFPFSLVILPEPRSLFDKRHQDGVDVALDEEMVEDAYLEMFDVVSDVAQDGNAHDEQVELYIFDLPLQLFHGVSLEDALHLLLFFLLGGHLFFLSLFLPLGLPILEAVPDLLRYFLVAVVDDLDKKVAALVNGGPVEHEDL